MAQPETQSKRRPARMHTTLPLPVCVCERERDKTNTAVCQHSTNISIISPSKTSGMSSIDDQEMRIVGETDARALLARERCEHVGSSVCGHEAKSSKHTVTLRHNLPPNLAHCSIKCPTEGTCFGWQAQSMCAPVKELCKCNEMSTTQPSMLCM